MKHRLASIFRNTVLTLGDRDDHRMFNKDLKKFKYLSFYGYTEKDDDDNGYFLVGFSDSDKEGYFVDRYDVSALVPEGYFKDYLTSNLALHVHNTRLVVSTDEIEPIPITPVSWDALLKADVICSGEAEHLAYSVFEYMENDMPYEADAECVNFINKCINEGTIRLDVVYRNEHQQSHRMYLDTTTLVYFNNEVVGFLRVEGRRGTQNQTTSCFDWNKFESVLKYIIDNAGLQKYKKSSIVVVDLTHDCDEYTFVPGVTNPRGGSNYENR